VAKFTSIALYTNHFHAISHQHAKTIKNKNFFSSIMSSLKRCWVPIAEISYFSYSKFTHSSIISQKIQKNCKKEYNLIAMTPRMRAKQRRKH
jgi:hypothetical protein